METSDVQNWITAACAVLTLLAAGGGCFWKVCRLMKTARETLASAISAIQAQNALQSEQIATLSEQVRMLLQRALSGHEDGR